AARKTSRRRAPPAIANSWKAREHDGAISVPASGPNVIWIAEDLSLIENGAIYGPALDGIGVAPERLITVAAARRRAVLGAREEALRCRAVAMVIAELPPRGMDQAATRRLALAAAAGSALGLILSTAPDAAPSAAVTRWVIGAASSLNAERGHDIGPPR